MTKKQIKLAKKKIEHYEKLSQELNIRVNKNERQKKNKKTKKNKILLNKANKGTKERGYTSYKDYLQSPEWKKIRLKILKRANNTCELCKMRRAYQVHHKTYKRIYHERLTDLIAVCGICHLDKHGLLNEDQLENAVNKLIQKEGYQ